MQSMPQIDAYEFGRMTINRRTYTSDLVILPAGPVHSHWIRKSGHLLIRQDIQALIDAVPDLIIIGTGASGRMQVDPSLVSYLNGIGIKTKIHPSSRAVAVYNAAILTGTTVGACFHLTC